MGCGPGNLKTECGNRFEYTGIDYAEKMLELAEKKGYRTILGNLEEELPKLADNSFDYVVSLGTLLFVQDIKLILFEFERIARKGWLASFDDVTESYQKNYTGNAPIYNHSKIELRGPSEDVHFRAWTSPTTGDEINVRMVFKKI